MVIQTFGSSVVVAIFNFLGAALVARLLDIESRGVLATYQLYMLIIAGVAQLGLSQSFVFVVRGNGAFDVKGNLSLSLILIVSVVIFLYLVAEFFLGGLEEGGAVFWGSLVFAAYTFFLGVMQVFHGLVRFNLIGALYSLFYFSFVAILFFFDISMVGLVFWGQVLIYLILSFLMVYWVFYTFGKGKGQESERRFFGVTDLFRHGFGFYGVSLIGLFVANIDKFIINYKGAMEVMGLYVVAYTASRVITLFQNSLATIVYSRYAGDVGRGAEIAASLSFRLTFIPLLMVAFLAFLMSEQLMVLIFGEKYRAAAPIFSILIFEAVIGGASWVLAQCFNAVGRSGVVLVRQVISIAPVFIVVPFLTEEYLGVGLAFALILSAVLRLAITLSMYRFMLGFPVPSLIPSLADISLILNFIKKA